ncbi:hypothetical protein M9H77_14221 [Catharanthus roseus]|uniref:Uncharacterized protein n=1 Tax=Catharanthus roseus TaxID=4058 RepID=A0ACC0BMQ4_CATRO|nr:hypothetical protein M9H77_14221 [Catharanthus roseus]
MARLKFCCYFCAAAVAISAPAAADSAASVSPTAAAAEVSGFCFNYSCWLSCFCFNISLISAASLRSFSDLLCLTSAPLDCCMPPTASNVCRFCLF